MSGSRDYKAITVELTGHVLQITLNRPEQLNAVDEEMHEDLIHALKSVDTWMEVRSIVLASTGKHFSAGGDLNAIARIQSSSAICQTFVFHARELLKTLHDVRVPIVCALHGDAHGLGSNIVLSCDAVVAAKRARMSDSHVAAGMAAGDGGLVAWPAAMGVMWAKRHLLTGQHISAEAAYARGLVTDLVETSEEVLPAARALAEHIASLPPLAVQGTKRSFNVIMQARIAEVFEYGLAAEHVTLLSKDVVEAVAAFKEKRPPVYKGE